jgi:hypothetical protein
LNDAIDDDLLPTFVGSPARRNRPPDGVSNLRRQDRHHWEPGDLRDTGVVLWKANDQHRATTIR